MPNRAEQRRSKILDAAAELLEHYGPQKTTVADIARQAGVAVGSVYLEFDSKDALVGALSTHRYQRVLDAMRAAADAAEPGVDAVLGALRGRTEALLAASQCGAHAGDLMHCGSCSGVSEALTWFDTAQRTLLGELLEDGLSKGGLSLPADADQTIDALLVAHEPFAPPALYKRACSGHVAALDALHALLRNGLAPR